MPHATPFHTWAWHRAAAQVEQADMRSIALVLRDHETTQAILPLVAERTTFRRSQVEALTWACGLRCCPEHLDVLASSDAPLDAFVPALEDLRWDVIILRDLAEHAPGVERLTHALRTRGHYVTLEPLHCCPYLDLPESWDEYLAAQSPSRRQLIRRKERKLQREHGATVTNYDASRFEEGWQHLLRLHALRWGGPGAFADPRISSHFRQYRPHLSPAADLWLTTLDLGGEPAAAWCGFTWKDTVYFYQGGRDPRWESQSAGLVLMATMIRRAIESGYRRFDFMRGDESYKRSWTPSERWTYEVVVYRRSLRGTWLRGLDLARRTRLKLRELRANRTVTT